MKKETAVRGLIISIGTVLLLISFAIMYYIRTPVVVIVENDSNCFSSGMKIESPPNNISMNFPRPKTTKKKLFFVSKEGGIFFTKESGEKVPVSYVSPGIGSVNRVEASELFNEFCDLSSSVSLHREGTAKL